MNDGPTMLQILTFSVDPSTYWWKIIVYLKISQVVLYVNKVLYQVSKADFAHKFIAHCLILKLQIKGYVHALVW